MKRTRIAAYGLVVDDGNMLLCRISEQLPQHTGYWTLPGGGIEFGEHPEEAMVREVFEETGLQVRASGVAAINSGVIPDASQTTHSIRILYYAEILGGNLVNEVSGTTDLCAWHEIGSVRDLPIVNLVEVGLPLIAQ